jgi:SecD/SecF fusion protein
MLENARRQFLLVCTVLAGAILALTLLKPNLGLDLEGGVSLIYEVDVQQAIRDELLPPNPSETDISRVMDTTVQILAERVDPQGTREAVVTRRGETGIGIDLPKLTDAESATVEAQIQSLGRLEFRMVAGSRYNKDGVSFNLQAERQALEAWLNANDGDRRKLVAKDPQAVNEFNATGTLNKQLRWYPRIIRPRLDRPEMWDYAESQTAEAGRQATAVAGFTPEEWNGGMVPDALKSAERPYLVEFLPINMHERAFAGKDLDPSYTRAGPGSNGKPALHYRMRPALQEAYADWSGEYVGERSAIIFNGEVYSAPVFNSRILGPAEIKSDTFTQAEVNALVKTLNTGSLPVKPIRQSRDNIGATLGADSIRLGALSIAAGAAILILFILWYYRTAGLIAIGALAINVVLIMALIYFLRATLTLPGLAGLVLTMGMAVDSNILIYERIREELERGKAMLQACRAGFERAIATIIDANLTTFIAGLVLYQIGVGPVRGFAVTLMVGIVTTLFTAYFVTRLLFHYMLERKQLGALRFNAWLKNAAFDFMGQRKLWVSLSVVFVVVGIAIFATTSPDTKYAIDFTGGANLKVVLKEPTDRDTIFNRLSADAEFKRDFPAPIVNTVGDTTDDGKARKFSIRVKLTETLRAQIDAARNADPTGYKPPYLAGIQRIFSDLLVPDAYSNAAVFPNATGTFDFAELSLHFVDPVTTESLQKALIAVGSNMQVRNLDGDSDPAGRNFKLEFGVPKATEPIALPGMVQERLEAITGVDGKLVSLSNPIPESSEIGGRMVGELRSAAINALFISMFAIVLYIRFRFHEFKYGIAAVASLLHDVLVTLGVVVLFNSLGLVDAEIDLSMIAAFLTVIGYSINDTIVIFDRVRENLGDAKREGVAFDRIELLNRSVNQTLSRTVLTTLTTMFVIVAQFVVNFHAGTALEGFSFALMIGMLSGTYSTIFIASPIVLWLWEREQQANETEAASSPSPTPTASA